MIMRSSTIATNTHEFDRLLLEEASYPIGSIILVEDHRLDRYIVDISSLQEYADSYCLPLDETMNMLTRYNGINNDDVSISIREELYYEDRYLRQSLLEYTDMGYDCVIRPCTEDNLITECVELSVLLDIYTNGEQDFTSTMLEAAVAATNNVVNNITDKISSFAAPLMQKVSSAKKAVSNTVQTHLATAVDKGGTYLTKAAAAGTGLIGTWLGKKAEKKAQNFIDDTANKIKEKWNSAGDKAKMGAMVTGLLGMGMTMFNKLTDPDNINNASPGMAGSIMAKLKGVANKLNIFRSKPNADQGLISSLLEKIKNAMKQLGQKFGL